jgi:hypothetical protein
MKLDKSNAWLLAKSALVAVCTAEGISANGCDMLGMGIVPTMVTTGSSALSCAQALQPAQTDKTAKDNKDGRCFLMRTF